MPIDARDSARVTKPAMVTAVFNWRMMLSSCMEMYTICLPYPWFNSN